MKSMKRKDKCWWLMVLLVLAVTACGERPTGPDVADLDPVAAFVKPDGKPGGGGKPDGDGGDIPLRVELNDGTDGIRSDGYPEYVHDSAFVSAVIRDNGMLYFQTFDGKRKDPVLRGVTVELGTPLEAGSLTEDDLANLEAFADEVGFAGDVTQDWPPFTSDVTLHTRSLNGGMIDMGATLLDAGKIGFNDYGDVSWEWRLLFGERVETPEGGVDHYEEGLCVTHPTETTWEVTIDGADCGADFNGVAQLWRVVGGDFIHVADFNTPMHLTLTRK